MVYKSLEISGALLDKNQLLKYMEKIAAEHTIKINSNKNTYPIPSLNENYQFIFETYKLLNEHIKLGIKIHSAGEWILDNFYIIEEMVKSIKKELTLKKYLRMIGIASGKYEGFARSYVLAGEIVSYSDCKLDSDLIYSCLEAYQNYKMLSIEEIANFGVFLKIAIINHIKEVCERIFSSQIQRFKVEEIIERLVEQKDVKERVFINRINYNSSFENELKYPFIEYMSYRLKKYGKLASKYQEILESEVQKMGLTVNEVVQKEHLYIATLKITIGNCIKSLKDISRIDFTELLGKMNGTEEILNKDPVGVYENMEQESKSYYKSIIEKMSKKSKVSEVYIAEKALELAKRYEKSEGLIKRKKAHVGYYLIDEGLAELKSVVFERKIKNKSLEFKARIYIGAFWSISLLLNFLITLLLYFETGSLSLWLVSYLLMFVPVSEIVIRCMNYLMSKFKSPTLIPKLNFEEGIPPESTTFVVIPTILKTKEKVIEMIKKLEVYYLANPHENLYFALLGDVSEEQNPKMKFDEEVVKTGISEIQKLNKKYKTNDFNRFHFLYRKRVWSDTESKFIGWERKRGILVEFNRYIKGLQANNFLANTIEEQKENIPNIKYVITLDSDTNLSLNSAGRLVGSMSHILNLPVIEEKKVVHGYGIMQPRIGLDLDVKKKTKFAKIYSIPGGIDFYTNAISDIYQDYFKEGIFTGKGIYDVNVYNEILEDEIPENTVLSHDLLEGNFLRLGLLTDVMLLDGYPCKYISYMKRNHRWIRGDFQIIKWLRSKKLNDISKFKIFDNLRRAILKVASLILLVFSFIAFRFNFTVGLTSLILSLVSIVITYLLNIVNSIVFKESQTIGSLYSHKKFSKDLSDIPLNFYKLFLEIVFLPYEAWISFDAMIRSIYRMIKKKRLLEWVTAEDSENKTKNNPLFTYKEMIFNVIIGVLFLFGNIAFKILGILFLVAPYIAFLLSKEIKDDFEISENDKKDLREIAFKTWKFFEDNLNEENHYLICDNYQEDRKEKTVKRTSSTNIGLELLSIMSAYDLGFIDFEKTIDYIKKVINTIKLMSKWNGHLYNWYETDTLEPLKPRYISTVDSGNLVGYLYVVKEFLNQYREDESIDQLYEDTQKIIVDTDFSKLYSEKNKLFSIGFNLEENSLTDSYYDFLASEARQSSIVALSRRQVPVKHWNSLSRTITIYKGYKGLISWTGTAFEYLMPNLNLKRYEGSLLDESSKFAIMSQKDYCQELGVPWGISESAYNLKDLNNNYQYKAFGIPWLGLKRGLEYDLVISPYSTFLALQDGEKSAIENIRELKKVGAYGKYGFYESIDYTLNRLKEGQDYAVVKTYMAHHQGLILNSINNVLNENIIQTRFNNNPEIEAVNILLEERMPVDLIITKEKKETPEKFKNYGDIGYIERVIDEPEKLDLKYNVISNSDYKIVVDDFGEGYSQYKDIFINRYKPNYEIKQGIFFYVKNLKTKKIIEIGKQSKVSFTGDKAKFIRQDGGLKFTYNITVNPNKPVEIRSLEIENLGSSEEVLDVTVDFIPCLSRGDAEYAHPAFNSMFLDFKKEQGNIVIERREKTLDKFMYAVVNLYTENGNIVDNGFEIDKEKYIGRNNFDIPIGVKSSKKFENQLNYVINKIYAERKTVKIAQDEKICINFLISVNEDKEEAIKNIEQMKNEDEIQKVFDVGKARIEEEMKYLQINSKQAEEYQELLNFVLDENVCKDLRLNLDKDYEINSLWKYGISGDLPIILVKIKSLNSIDNVKEIIESYMFFRVKNIYVDLVILDEEKEIYNRLVQKAVEDIVMDKQIIYLRNIKSGIFILNKNLMEADDLSVLELKSKIILVAENGGTSDFLKSKTTKILDKFKIDEIKEDEEIIERREENLQFFNGYGGFTLNGKEYKFAVNKENSLPTIWSNCISNKMFGTIVTENMCDIIWNKNSRLNRITSWNNDTVLNIPSQIIYVRDIDNNKVWTLNSNIMPNKNYYYITYGFGYAKYENVYDGILQETDIFVPQDLSACINKIRLKNTTSEAKNLKIIAYVKTVLGEDESVTSGNIYIDKKNNIVFAKNYIEIPEFQKIAYITSNEKILNYTKSKKNFFGRGDLKLPDLLFINNFENQSGIGDCIGLEFEINLEAYEEKFLNLVIGQENKIQDIENQAESIVDTDFINNALNEIYSKWLNLNNTLIVQTPEDDLNIMMNGWLIYQTIDCRIWAKTAFYQSGGAYGFRDQLQDCIGMKYIDLELLKEQIIKCAEHQFLEGDVLHWWHEETKKGCRTNFSDDLLWLPYSVAEYINISGDYSILEETLGFLKGENLKEEEQEIYNQFYKTEEQESIYNHCIRAIDRASNFGENGFPKIGSGDWNDGFSNIGTKGKGESIWLGFFLYDILNKFLKICEYKNDNENKEKYEKIKDELRRNLNTRGWDGRWFKRAITDDGNVLGSVTSEECKIDSISQSWGIISDCADNDKKYISIEEAENNLVDRENKIIKLFWPAFKDCNFNPGYIKAYPVGIRENGGQYTHAAVWFVIALAKLGFGDKAVQFCQMINPINHSLNIENARKYKVEPYVISADVYSAENLKGTGGWSWYTGSSGWYYDLIIEYILGLKIESKYIKIEPCISKEWKEYEIHYKYKTSAYNIKVKNPDKKNIGVSKFLVNGEEIKDKKILLVDDGKIYNIEIIM